MKLGIVGSSYSAGNVIQKGLQLSKPFEHWFKGITVFNGAASSKGTELYLDKVVYLKKNYDIDTLLIESVNNRSMWNIKCTTKNYAIIQEETNIERIIEDVYNNSYGLWNYQRFLTQQIDYLDFGDEKQFITWQKFQTSIAASKDVNEFWAMVDIAQTINLCEMLKIKIFIWACRWELELLPSFYNMIKNHTYIKFGNYPNAYEYYANKYGSNNICCDDIHFKDSINEEMINDFIIPKLLQK